MLLAGDHWLFRAGVRLILESQPDVQVVGEAATGTAAVRQCRRLQPDVVVMDLTMPDGWGLEATATIKQELPQTHVLALTMQDNREYFFRVLQAGDHPRRRRRRLPLSRPGQATGRRLPPPGRRDGPPRQPDGEAGPAQRG
ncbi:MAG TPA: response regulator transcription factor [Chloroflexota bacterium]|nr:response regulator transcription factor [Chloroflexota bacterium]